MTSSLAGRRSRDRSVSTAIAVTGPNWPDPQRNPALAPPGSQVSERAEPGPQGKPHHSTEPGAMPGRGLGATAQLVGR